MEIRLEVSEINSHNNRNCLKVELEDEANGRSGKETVEFGAHANAREDKQMFREENAAVGEDTQALHRRRIRVVATQQEVRAKDRKKDR